MSTDIIARGLAANAAPKRESRNSFRMDGWHIIATNPWSSSGGSIPSATPVNLTRRNRHKATAKASKIKLIYANINPFNSVSMNPNYNPIRVAAALQKYGSSSTDVSKAMIPAWFNGRHFADVAPSTLVETDPVFFDVSPGDDFFTWDHIDTIAAAAPSAPSLADSATGGSLVGGATYRLCVVYVFPDGRESLTSAETSITLAAGANTRKITVTSPAAAGGAVGYAIYMSGRNSGSALFSIVAGLVPLGTNYDVTLEAVINPGRIVRAAGVTSAPQGCGTAGGVVFAGLNSGEMSIPGDVTIPVGYTVNDYGGTTFGPVVMLGKVIGPTPKTIAFVGDSILAGTGDNGSPLGQGGHGTRAVNNQLALKWDYTTAPLYGHVRLALGGEQIAQFADITSANQYDRSRYAIADYATNVISNYGTNDLGLGLSSMKANVLTLAAWYCSRGQKFFQETLLPRTTSTDGFQTVSNQTVTASESVRLGFNQWVRDPSSNGFVAQVIAINPAFAGYVDYIEVGKYIEVNASNVLTQDGGFWIVSTASPIKTGTLGAGSTSSSLVDGSGGMTSQAYKGYSLILTSGTYVNGQGCIYYNNANTFDLNGTSVGGSPSAGDTYAIKLLPTLEGVHPHSWTTILAAQAVQEKFGALI